MSEFNTANELAAQLVWGQHYQTDEPCPKIEQIVFYRNGHPGKLVFKNDGAEWACVANEIEVLLLHGYEFQVLPCQHCGATEFDRDHQHEFQNSGTENVEAL